VIASVSTRAFNSSISARLVRFSTCIVHTPKTVSPMPL
jgi:hypothetical protein